MIIFRLRVVDRKKIEIQLCIEVEKARQRVKTATARFAYLTGYLPSGIPPPDGPLMIKQAGSDERAAYKAYIKAVLRLQDFCDNGIIPCDLAKKRSITKDGR